MRETRAVNSASESVVDLAAVMLGGADWTMVLQMPILLVLRPTEELSQASTGTIAAATGALRSAAVSCGDGNRADHR